jgi:aldose 1-epimerase
MKRQSRIGPFALGMGASGVALCAALLCAVPAWAASSGASKALWGTTPKGEKVYLFTLRNANGMQVRITNYGGIIVGIVTPDRAGHMDDVLEGVDTLDEALKGGHLGAIIGRYANRIAGARFALDGKTVELVANSGSNQIHGGPVGFSKRVWTAKAKGGAQPSLTLRLTSPDGDQGFPGTLKVTVVYTLTKDNALRIDYRASTDKDTVVNLTNHSYFALKGEGMGDSLNTELQIFASKFTPAGDALISTGEILPVAGTPFDFTKPTTIGSRIAMDDPQLVLGRGYDHNYVLDGAAGTLRLGARAHDPVSGRILEMWTTQPGVQLYTSNSATLAVGKGGKTYALHGAFCLETQHYPNSPNQPNFPSTDVTPKKPLHEVTIYRFSTDRS